MNKLDISDLRFSSSSIDDFWADKPKIKTASAGKTRIAGVIDLQGFSFVADDTLVRLSQQDFWKLGHDDEGYFVERLVDDDEGPVKG